MTRAALLSRWIYTMGICAGLWCTAHGQTSERPFTESMSAETKAKIGLQKLSAEQIAALNQQISRELTLARQGNVKGFAKTFSQRRNAADLENTGLGNLTDEQKTELDRSIAWAMAVPIQFNGPTVLAREEIMEFVKPKSKITGEMSVTVGAGSGGRTLMGGSIAMTYKDPDRNLAATVRYSEYKGDRWLVDDLYYGYPYMYELSGTQRSVSVSIELGKK